MVAKAPSAPGQLCRGPHLPTARCCHAPLTTSELLAMIQADNQSQRTGPWSQSRGPGQESPHTKLYHQLLHHAQEPGSRSDGQRHGGSWPTQVLCRPLPCHTGSATIMWGPCNPPHAESSGRHHKGGQGCRCQWAKAIRYFCLRQDKTKDRTRPNSRPVGLWDLRAVGVGRGRRLFVGLHHLTE